MEERDEKRGQRKRDGERKERRNNRKKDQGLNKWLMFVFLIFSGNTESKLLPDGHGHSTLSPISDSHDQLLSVSSSKCYH